MARERGDAVAILFAAEWGIYGRFGYAPAHLRGLSYHLDPADAGRRCRQKPHSGGTLRQVEPAEIGKYGPEIFDAARRRRAGNIDREAVLVGTHVRLARAHAGQDPRTDTDLHPAHRRGWSGRIPAAGSATGTMDDDGSNAIDVVHLCTATPQAYRDLWTYLTNLDLVERIRLGGRPVDEPVRWLLGDGRALRQAHHADALWLRVLDVPAAMSARRRRRSRRADIRRGEMTTSVVMRQADLRFAPTQTPPSASRHADAAVELRIGQRALASCYLGGVSLRAQLDAGQVEGNHARCRGPGRHDVRHRGRPVVRHGLLSTRRYSRPVACWLIHFSSIRP